MWLPLQPWTRQRSRRCSSSTSSTASDPDLDHDMYHDDAVLKFPQSGERFEGVKNFREWRSIYPAGGDLRDPRDPRA